MVRVTLNYASPLAQALCTKCITRVVGRKLQRNARPRPRPAARLTNIIITQKRELAAAASPRRSSVDKIVNHSTMHAGSACAHHTTYGILRAARIDDIL